MFMQPKRTMQGVVGKNIHREARAMRVGGPRSDIVAAATATNDSDVDYDLRMVW